MLVSTPRFVKFQYRRRREYFHLALGKLGLIDSLIRTEVVFYREGVHIRQVCGRRHSANRTLDIQAVFPRVVMRRGEVPILRETRRILRTALCIPLSTIRRPRTQSAAWRIVSQPHKLTLLRHTPVMEAFPAKIVARVPLQSRCEARLTIMPIHSAGRRSRCRPPTREVGRSGATMIRALSNSMFRMPRRRPDELTRRKPPCTRVQKYRRYSPRRLPRRHKPGRYLWSLYTSYFVTQNTVFGTLNRQSYTAQTPIVAQGRSYYVTGAPMYQIQDEQVRDKI